MPADLQQARELFLYAVGKLPPEQWDAYLAEACGPFIRRRGESAGGLHGCGRPLQEATGLTVDLQQVHDVPEQLGVGAAGLGKVSVPLLGR